MLALLALAMLGASATGCAAPFGTAEMLDRPQQIIVVGETHGTAEAPAAFSGMVCEAAQRGPVTIGLEVPESDQLLFDWVMAAPDEATAARILRGGDFGDPRRDDGRHSEAMFQMILDLWRLKAAGRDVAIHAFAPRMSVIRGRDQAWWELEMAYGMSRALTLRPQARVLILVGDLHARKTALERLPDIGLPAAGHLHAEDTLALHFAQQGGESWGCQAKCGRQTSISVYDPAVRGVVLGPVSDGAYDGVLAVGPTTASPPAARAEPAGSTASDADAP